MKEVIQDIAESKGFKVDEFASGNGDHVHLFVTAPPKLSPSLLIQYLKGITGRKLSSKSSCVSVYALAVLVAMDLPLW